MIKQEIGFTDVAVAEHFNRFLLGAFLAEEISL